MKYTAVVLLLMLSLTTNGLLWSRVSALEKKTAVPPADYPLGEMMGYMQRYADKLWFAGEAGNWDLANFYQGEIAETAADIGHAQVVKEGVEVSKVLGAMLPPAVDAVAQAVAAHDAARFRRSYRAMVISCNACHQAARHPFIQIAVPTGPPTYWNQQFARP